MRRLFELWYFANEYLIMSIISKDGPGWFFRRLFRGPIWLYRMGLGALLGGQVLLLTTTGRKSGLPRTTALGFVRHADEDAYYVTAGWDGRTDWYRNVRANPRVSVRVGRRRFESDAEVVPEERVVQFQAEYTRRNPFAARMYPRWTGRPFDGSEAALREVAPHFPMIALRPRA
jgi:deazaflavin-dependent oxidoreductase (nitroreductase family)